MTLAQPAWLLMAIPLAAALWLWPMPGKLLAGLRIATTVLLVGAMAGLCVRAPGRDGVVVAVVDRSLSMPVGAQQMHEEACRLVHASMGKRDLLAVVSFADTAALEQPPGNSPPAGLNAQVGQDASNLADALELAVSVIGSDRPGRVLVLSDGEWTGRDPSSVLARAVALNVPIDYRLIRRPVASDLVIDGIEAPTSVAAGEGFAITAWVDCPTAQEVTYELYRGDVRIGAGARVMEAGLNRLSFRDLAAAPGALRYELRVEGPGEDPMPENNRAKLLVGVRGPLPVLCAHGGEGPSGLAALVSRGQLAVRDAPAQQRSWELEDLAGYSAIILEDVPAHQIGEAGLANLAAWVRTSGAGLMMTGGRGSYGTGGYFKSALEGVLPVSMELRQEHRKMALAIVVALDRSGSMSMPVGGGRTKIDLADLGTAQVLDLLGPMDEMGVLAVDSLAHLIVPLTQVTDKAPIRDKILRIQSLGGGIFIYEALSNAAAMVATARAGTKHIILFADAADSEEPGEYRALLEKCRQAGITVSVIGLGASSDQDANLLHDIARRGNGRVYFTNSATELPKLFAQDTFIVSRSSFVDEQTPVKPTAGLMTMTGNVPQSLPDVGGYNLTYLRPEATLGILTQDEYKAPVVASWQVGSGRVLCYTGQADGEFAGPMARWDQVGEFFTSLVRWTAGAQNPLPPTMLATQELSEGLLKVRLMLDPQAQESMSGSLPVVNLLRGRIGRQPESTAMKMQWVAPDELAVEVPLAGDQTAIASVELADGPRVTLSPVCLPYSPEYRRVDAGSTRMTLADLAEATGGRERLELADVWKDLAPWSRLVDLRPWLLLAAGLLLMLEVLQRRTGLVAQAGKMAVGLVGAGGLTGRLGRWWAQGRAARAQAWAQRHLRVKPKGAKGSKAPSPAGPQPGQAQPSSDQPQPTQPPEPTGPQPPKDQQDVVAAMKLARRRTRGKR